MDPPDRVAPLPAAPDPVAYVHTVRIHPVDTDRQGVVHASRYLPFLEAAMIETMRAAAGSYEAVTRGGIDLVMAEVNIRYLSPARFDELLDITASLRRLGTTSVTVDFHGRTGDRPVIAAWARYVAFSPDSGEKTPITGLLRQVLNRFPESNAAEERR
jgi:acyl-CoA thioester hydrolase